jgi:hypothetical protein
MSRSQDPQPLPNSHDSLSRSEPVDSPNLNARSQEHADDGLSLSASSNALEHPLRSAEPREVYEMRGRSFRLRRSEVAAMVEIGKFRAIAQEDLTEFFYAGDKARFRPDVENLVRQDLVEMKSIPHEEKGSRALLALTKQGRFVTKNTAAPTAQILYHGFTKPREAHHDADLYRLYQKAAEKIESSGGKSLRVILDYELKKRVYHDLAKLGKEQVSSSDKRPIAERHGLKMVHGKIPMPDVRIEYETRDGEKARIDLELATGHYRGRNLAEKVRAGFSLYAHADETSKLRRDLDQRELTAEILPL